MDAWSEILPWNCSQPFVLPVNVPRKGKHMNLWSTVVISFTAGDAAAAHVAGNARPRVAQGMSHEERSTAVHFTIHEDITGTNAQSRSVTRQQIHSLNEKSEIKINRKRAHHEQLRDERMFCRAGKLGATRSGGRTGCVEQDN